jgi:hypothetical protein
MIFCQAKRYIVHIYTYCIPGVKAMLLLKVVADEGHLNLDVAERAREVLPQLTIFCNKQDPKIKDFFSCSKRKERDSLYRRKRHRSSSPSNLIFLAAC